MTARTFPLRLALPAAVVACLCLPLLAARRDKAVSARVCTAFGRECEPLVVETIQLSRKEVDVAIFCLARRRIAEALVQAAGRGVKVRIKVDAEQAKFEYTTELLELLEKSGATVERITMPEDRHMHHKFAIVDRQSVITGSFNWTRQASEENWENVVTIESRTVSKRFREEWNSVGSRDAGAEEDE